MPEKAIFMSKQYSSLVVVYNVGGDQRVYDENGMIKGEFKDLPNKHVQFARHRFETDDPTLIRILENSPFIDSPESTKEHPDAPKMFYRLSKADLEVIDNTHRILQLEAQVELQKLELTRMRSLAFPGDTAPQVIDGSRGTARQEQQKAAASATATDSTPATGATDAEAAPTENPVDPLPFKCKVPGCPYPGAKKKQGRDQHMRMKHPQGRKRT